MNTSTKKQGQIVEIPRDSHHYALKKNDFLSKRGELEYHSSPLAYNLFDGILIGGHYGMDEFRIGQRKGLNISGKDKPVYVIKIDKEENRLFVGAGDDHPGLYQKVFFFPNEKITGFSDLDLHEDSGLKVIAKHNTFSSSALLYRYKDGIFLEFEKPTKIFQNNAEITIFKDSTLIGKLIFN